MYLQLLSLHSQIDDMTSNLKEKALKKYKDALKMPRKKKKQAKKSAILLYNIACWGDDIIDY